MLPRNVLYLVFRAVGLVRCVLLRLSSPASASVGCCRFLGTKEFIAKCEQALALLHEIDRDVYSALTGKHLLTFYYLEQAQDDDHVNGSYSITRDALKWGTEGIVCRFLYALFKQEAFGTTPFRTAQERDSLHNQLRARMKSWLAKHGFATGLISQFD